MIPSSEAPITAVSGLIINSTNQVLMGLRHATQSPPSVWEIPGGKVERGEHERPALVREMQEELGVKVIPLELISVATFHADRRLNLLLYVCHLDEHKALRPMESQELQWVSMLDARLHRPCLPSFYLWYSDILAHLDNPNRAQPYFDPFIE
jgi:8-oxo-dGTP diphosphatase